MCYKIVIHMNDTFSGVVVLYSFFISCLMVQTCQLLYFLTVFPGKHKGHRPACEMKLNQILENNLMYLIASKISDIYHVVRFLSMPSQV